MGFIQKDALRTMVITYFGLLLGYLNKGVLFVLILNGPLKFATPPPLLNPTKVPYDELLDESYF